MKTLLYSSLNLICISLLSADSACEINFCISGCMPEHMLSFICLFTKKIFVLMSSVCFDRNMLGS